MSFDAHELRIRKIFVGDTIFTIPRNQRKYVWTEKQWRELLGDIFYIKNMKAENKQAEINHFFGSFVLQEHDNINEVIDGQQRITTLIILLSSICVLFNEMNNKEQFGITKQYLLGNIGLQSQFIRLKNDTLVNLALIVEQATEYRENILTNSIFDEILFDKLEEGNKKIIECFYFYYGMFKERAIIVNDLIEIRDIVLDIKVIRIASEDELDCYDIFEILNARGVELEEGELLKNYIYKYARPKYSIDRAKEIWTKIEYNMRECNSNMEQFLSHFVTYKYSKPTRNEGVYRIIKVNTEKEKVNELLDDLYEDSCRYIWFYYPEKATNKTVSTCLAYFKMINHRQFRPLFLSIFRAFEKGKISENDMENICLYLRNFSYAFTLVVGNTSNSIENIIYDCAKEICDFPCVENLRKLMRLLEVHYPDYNTFERCFLNLGFSNKNKQYRNSNNRKRAFYILKEIEEFQQKTSELRCNVEGCNIEHLMNDSETSVFPSKIGNLLLLSEKINGNMGDTNFNTKKNYLMQSNLITVKNFLKYYGDNDTWDQEKIEYRTKKIANFAYENVWKLNF